LLPRLAALPEVGGRENVAMFAWFGLAGGSMMVDGFRVYPAGAQPYGTDMIGAYARDFEADAVITLIDVWTQHGVGERVAPAKWLPWFPVDGAPVAARVRAALDTAHRPLVYSRWGLEELHKAGVERALYVPHGVEPKTFRVLDEAERAHWREEWFPGVEHLTLMVAANKGSDDRKHFQGNLRAWAAFAAGKPQARLYVHTEAGTRFGGYDLTELARELGILDRVVFADQRQYWMGYPENVMVALYNCADALIAGSKSEGFGLPILEAQACGTPVVTTDFASMSELVMWGERVAPADLCWSHLGCWWSWPDWRGMQAALERLYEDWALQGGRWPMTLRREASRWAHEEYGWDRVVEDYWQPVIAELADQG